MTAQIVTLNDVIKATSLSRSTIYRMVKSGTFPQPLALTSKRCGFYAHEVNEWISSLPRGIELKGNLSCVEDF
ncbi:phage transcriptional regulator AlpA [Neptunomonas japonica JAMM 1380]|uniref:Phage transcriptional regulator AlpA n=1 Tax=Neptunomonas japonica JAMM 1380 TaxID=1441457 RepID=A0A7R6PCZ9_9GAMM|nr:phage transcriptional regulator AlpA [Neptunomonas japonica JAMM 1380]